VTNNLDTLLTALYVDLTDRVLPALGWTRDRRPGRKPALNDAELLCLAVAQHLLGIASERRWIRYARAHLAGLFPRLPGQSGYGKRLRAQAGLLAAVITELARDTGSWHDLLRLVDSTPLPCAASRETVKRSDLAGHAGYGYCASHSRFFWGFRLYLITTAEGMPVIWGLAHPGTGEREVTRALLERDHHLIRAGQIILGDKGFAGRDFENFITGEPGAHLIRPDRKDETPRFGRLARQRQWIEAIFDTLKGQLTLENHGGRTLAGVYARVAARLLALAAAIWHNWHTDAPVKRSLLAYDH
jgi:Transposase DDE domain